MKLANYLREIHKELKLTTFPTQNLVINFTVFVILFTAIMAVYLGALDLGFGGAIIKGINSAKLAIGSNPNNIVELASSTISTSTPVSTSTSATNTLLNTVPANILQ